MTTNDNAVVLYEAPDGETTLEVRLDQETVWLTQDQMAELFGRERTVITKHLRNVFKEGELEENSVRAKYAHTAADGKEYQTQFYNLDAIISVGYRVNSKQGTRFFRQSAVDATMKHESDNPSIGLILCKDRKGLIAEYALKDLNKPVGASEYQLVASIPENLKGSLPAIEELEAEFSEDTGEQADVGNTGKPARKYSSAVSGKSSLRFAGISRLFFREMLFCGNIWGRRSIHHFTILPKSF